MAYNNDPNDRSSAFPTFLGQDPYPATNDGRPTTSSSYATSESDGTVRSGTVPATTGPVGEPGLPPSRPMSNATNEQAWQRGSSTRTALPPPPSRRGMVSPFGRKDSENGSRPTSAIGGQTHVPSLAAQGFFRPMSPQMIQAQRGQNVPPSSRSQSALGQHHESVQEEQQPSETRSHRHRYSNASVNTERDAKMSSERADIPPLPVSRGFSIATSSADGNGVQSSYAPDSVASKNSVAPLNVRQAQEHPKLGAINGTPAPPRSPLSFRASFGLTSRHSSKRDIHDRKPSRSHEKLSSNPASPEPTHEKPVSASLAPQPGQPKGKNYEYFAGNMLFFLSGRCLNTKAKPLNVVTFILTVLPAALFFGFSAPWLWHHISPAMPIIFAYVFFVTISSFLHAAFGDPGILPRNLHPHPPNPDEDRDPLTVGPPTTEWVMVKTFPSQRKQPNAQDAAESGSANAGATTAMEVPTKYCKSCSIWRSPRAHHCRVCDACIETQDHHCVWLNNCVGRRNYRYFFAYVGFASLLALLLLAFSISHIAIFAERNNISFGAALSGRTQERVAFAMFIYSILALPYPGSLFAYHLFLVARGETTREYLNSHKFLPKDRHRPFSQSSFWKNWAAVLGRPRPPSYMAFKRRYEEGDVRMGHTMRRQERVEIAKKRAVESDQRVNGLKKRFSVPKEDVEMKQLPPLPQQGQELEQTGKDLTGMKLPGGSDSTPR